jgi:Asp-tRNA(Asn)/Glu-tRNA(Gln) amidotransferase B subunit
MLLTDDFLKRWGEIVEQVDKEHIPIDCVKKIIFRDPDRRQKTINLKRLRNQGLNDEQIEEMVEIFIRNNENSITSMEFILDVEAVAGRLQPETDRLLKGM